MEKDYSVIKELFSLERQLLEKIDEHPGYKYPLYEEGIRNRFLDLFDSQKIKCPKGYTHIWQIFDTAHKHIGKGDIPAGIFIRLLHSLFAILPSPIEIASEDKEMIKRTVIQIVKLGFVMTKYEQEEDYERIMISFQEFPKDVVIDLCKFRNESDLNVNQLNVCKEIESFKEEMRRFKNDPVPDFIRKIYNERVKAFQERKSNLEVELQLKKLLWQLKKDYYNSTLDWSTGASSWCPHCEANGTGSSLILHPTNSLRPSISIGNARRKSDYYCNHGID